MSCQTCGCSPCSCVPCPPPALNQPRLFNPVVSGGLFTNGVWQSATINAPTINGGAIIGATIDCTTQACTQAPGVCDGSVATTGFVCQAVGDAISGLNPAFCAAVDVCLTGAPSTCALVINCINTQPGSIFNPAAFDPSVYANTVQYGVTRYATQLEVQGASALIAIDPATLGAFWSAGGPNALWTSFEAGVCAAGASCFAPIANPIFTGDPQAPTPLAGDNDTSIATTAFVTAAVTGLAPVNNPILTGNPQAPTPLAGDNSTSIATTAYVQNELVLLLTPSLALCAAVTTCGFALLASPVLIGNPTGPTAVLGDNSFSLATTAFVQQELGDQINSLNPAFCAAVAGCATGGTGLVIATGQATFTTSGVALTDGLFTGSVYDTNGTIVLSGTNARFLFTNVQANTDYAVTFGVFGLAAVCNVVPHVITKATTHFDFNVMDLGVLVLAAEVAVTVSR